MSAALAKIHIAQKDLGLDDDTYRDLLERVTGKRSSKGMSFAQHGQVLDEFKRLGWKPRKTSRKTPYSSKAYVRKIHALWTELGRRKVLNNPSRAGLTSFVIRVTKTPEKPQGVKNPEWLTPAEGNKVIEALKDWVARS